MTYSPDNPIIRFYPLARIANPPARADRSGMGSLPTRAYRYCDVITTASGLGWYIYPPCEFWLFFTGREVMFRFPGMEALKPLESIRFPGLTERFNSACPPHLVDCEPAFLTAIKEPGIIQIWSGLLVRTAPGWSINIRAPVNIPPRAGFDQFEGMLETDNWFGPLFTNIRIEATGREIHFTEKTPLIQLVPFPRWAYAEQIQNAVPKDVTAYRDWSAEDWEAYDASFVAPARDPKRRIGGYAIEARKRRAFNGCAMHDMAGE